MDFKRVIDYNGFMTMQVKVRWLGH